LNPGPVPIVKPSVKRLDESGRLRDRRRLACSARCRAAAWFDSQRGGEKRLRIREDVPRTRP
jgi:hypothetical protein